jgi:hypothetical protein
MYEELTKHTNLIVVCQEIMTNEELKWFELKNIKLKLSETYKYIYWVQRWYKNGKHHRDNDLPAVITVAGSQYWYQNGQQHRDNDLPAVITAGRDQYWYKNGKIHRDNDLPAIIYSNTYRAPEFFKNGYKYNPNNYI